MKVTSVSLYVLASPIILALAVITMIGVPFLLVLLLFQELIDANEGRRGNILENYYRQH